MVSLSAKIRQTFGKKTRGLRVKGFIPAVLYGQKIKKSLALEIDAKEFGKVFKDAGASSLISLDLADEKTGKKEGFLVLVHDIERDPVIGNPIHIDFYQPNLEEEIEAKVPLIFEGEALAVKDLGGTLVKNVSQVLVKARPQNLPKEIKVAIGSLKTFEDSIAVKDLSLSEEGGVKIMGDPNNIVAFVAQPQKIEEELAKPVEEKVEEVEKVGEKKEGEEEGEAEVAPKAPAAKK